jgi:predicted nucleotidyltransferase
MREKAVQNNIKVTRQKEEENKTTTTTTKKKTMSELDIYSSRGLLDSAGV